METEKALSVTPSQEELFESERQGRIEFARRAAKRKDILGWGEALFPEKFELPFCHKLHDYFIDIRSDEFTNTEAPRYHSKTTIKCFLIPIFQALEEPKTFRHYLNVQATDDKALEVNRAIRVELETNDLLREMYGDQIGERWTDQRFVLANGVIFSAIGAGKSVRGINYRNVRPDYIIIDDLYDEDDIYSPTTTQKKTKWFWSSLYPARAKARKTSIHIQGTAINGDDLLEEAKKKPGIRSRTFKAVEEWEKGIVLWPELNTLQSLKVDQIRMGPIIFAREMQNERMDETTVILKRDQWKFYKELPSGFDIIVSSWDMTFKETKSGSYVVGQVWGRRGGDYYLFPIIVRGRMDFVNALIALQNLARTYPKATGHLIEDKANGPAVMSVLGRKLAGLVPILPHGTKVARAVAITPALAAGNIHIPDPDICPADPETGAPWVIGFIEECARFRGVDNEINDQVDTATQAVIYLGQTRYPSAEETDEESFIDAEDVSSLGEFSE
jgi:predicted phage terminase large subunit-like protein